MGERSEQLAVPDENRDSEARSIDTLLEQDRVCSAGNGSKRLAQIVRIRGVGYRRVNPLTFFSRNRARRLQDEREVHLTV